MAKHLEDARARLSEATKGISALCVRRPVLTIVAQPPDRPRRPRRLPAASRFARCRTSTGRSSPSAPTMTAPRRRRSTRRSPRSWRARPRACRASSRSPRRAARGVEPRRRRVRANSIDINVAANDLRDAVGNVERQLPEDVEDISIVKADDNSDAIMRLAVTAERHADPGPDAARRGQHRRPAGGGRRRRRGDDLYGDREPLVRVLIDPNALAARGLTVADLETALGTVALDAPAGSLSGNNQSLLVRADASVKSGEEIEAIQHQQVDPRRRRRRRDLRPGRARRARIRINGQTGIGLGIVRQAQSNTLDISTGVRAAVAELERGAAATASHIRVTSDERPSSAARSTKVLHDARRGDADRRRRHLPVPALGRAPPSSRRITVPIALIGTLAAIYLAGFSHQHPDAARDRARDRPRRRRRHRGAGEHRAPSRAWAWARAPPPCSARGRCSSPCIATTATLAAVFIPISFFPGTAGRLFAEFGFVMAFAVDASRCSSR